jgi:hypothetical protein
MRVSSSAQRGAVAPVRFGLVGYGFGARYFHAPLIASATECQLVAVATRSERREKVNDAFFDLADAIITVGSLIRRAWITHRWETRPARR